MIDPLLFLVCNNDLAATFTKFEIFLFANKSLKHISGSNDYDELQEDTIVCGWINRGGGGGGTTPETTKLEHIFVAVITFFSFLLCRYF